MPLPNLVIPCGCFRANTDDAAAAAQRRRIAQMLRNGQTVNISSTGTVHMPGQQANVSQGTGARRTTTGTAELVVPEGKLACS